MICQQLLQNFLSQPLQDRRDIASNMRDVSQSHNDKKAISIMDVAPSSIQEFFTEHQIDLLIHGHTHRPNTHEVIAENMHGVRIVLGDWHETGWCLTLEDQERRLEEFKL